VSPEAGRGRGRRQLLLLASLFLVPVAAAFLLYFSADWRPVPDVHGELIEPPRQLATPALRGRWFLVLPLRGECDADCLARLDELGRVRLALDKDAGRVRRVLLHDGGCCDAEFPLRYEDLLLLPATGAEGDALRERFPPVDGSEGIYIVDPHGNLIMGYPAAGSARGILKDLERLLRLSNIG
jgi:hypothetical protein